MDPARRLTRPQAELLRAVDRGVVADRYHLRLGWATRRTDRRSHGPGGALGLNVTATARRLLDMGLAEVGDSITDGDPTRIGDKPWRITITGRLTLAADAARKKDR